MSELEKNVDQIVPEEVPVEEVAEETVAEEVVSEEVVSEEVVSEEVISEEPVSENADEKASVVDAAKAKFADVVEKAKSIDVDAAKAKVADVVEKAKSVDVVEKAKGLSKKTIAIISGAVALVVVLALVVSLVLSSPLVLIGTGVKNSLSAIQKNDIVTLVDGVLNGGSIEVSADTEEITENVMGYGMDMGQVSAKVYTDLKNTSVGIVGSLKDGSETLADVSVFANNEKVVVKSDSLLGGDAYGISLKNFADDFNNSEFGPDGEYSLGFEMEDAAQNAFNDYEKLIADSEKIAKAAVTEFLKSVKKNAEISKEKSSISFDGKKVKTTAVSIEMDYEQLAEVVTDMMEYVSDDKNLEKYLTEYMEYVLAVSGGYFGYDEDDVQDLIDEFYESVDEVLDDGLDDMKDSLEDADISVKVTFHITKSGKQLVGIEAKGESYGSKFKGSVHAGPDLADITQITYSFDDDGYTNRGSYTVDTNSGKEFVAKVKLVDYRDRTTTVKINWDKKDGDFDVKIEDRWGDEYGVEGTMKQSGKKTTFNVASVTSYGEEIDLGVDVILSTSDSMNSISKFTNVFEMSVDEIETVIEEVQEVAMDMVENLDLGYTAIAPNYPTEAYPYEDYYYSDEYYY